MKKLAITAAVLAAAIAAPASAVTVVAEKGTNANFNVTYPGLATTTLDFNNGSLTTTGLTTNGSTGSYGVRTSGSKDQWSVPTPGDASPFASVQADSTLKLYTSSSAARGFDLISIYVGSVDTYNTIAVLNTAGVAIVSYTGQQLLNFANPVGTADGQTAYRITFTRQAGDVAFGGLGITSTGKNAAEFDNLVFAVPEPSTWALMLAGFGMVGMAMRSRRRRTTAVFA